MNILSSLLLLGLSSLPINMTFEEEVVVLTAEDIDKKRSPVFFAVHRVGETGLSIDFALTKTSGMAADVGPFQFSVLNEPVTLADLPGRLTRRELVVRTEVVGKDRATFELRNEEIPNSTLVIYLVDDSHPGTRNVQAYCLPLSELMKTVPLSQRHPLIGTVGPSVV